MQKNIKLLLVLALIFITACSSSQYSKESLDSLANCLADKNVKEYGAFWCPNCAKQEKMFDGSYDIIKGRGVYVECDPRCEVPEDELPMACRGIVGQTSLCLEKGVEGYPTWEFTTGEILVGVQELERLAAIAGCTFP